MQIPVSLLKSLLESKGYIVKLYGNRAYLLDGVGVYDDERAISSWLQLVKPTADTKLNEALCYVFLGGLPASIPRNYLIVKGVEPSDYDAVLNEINRIFYTFNIWDTHLIDAVGKGAELNELLEMSLAIFENPLMVYNSSMQLIGVAGIDETDIFNNYTLIGDRYYLSPSSLEGAKDVEMKVIASNSRHAFFEYIREPHHLECPVLLGDKTIAMLIVPMSLKPLSQEYSIFAERLAVYISQALSRRFNAGVDMSMILKRQTTERELMQYYCEMLDFNPRGTFQVLCVSDDQAQEADRTDLRFNRFDSGKAFRKSFTTIIDGLYVKVLYEPSIEPQSSAAKRAQGFLKKHHLRAGISYPFKGFEHIADYYDQALFALNSTDAPLTFFEDHLGDYILKMFEETHRSESFIHPAVAKLSDIDAGGILQETLLAYLTCSKSYTQATEKLNIHKSTLKYRLDKIKGIIPEELLQNEKSSLNLQLSLLISLKQASTLPGMASSSGTRLPPT
ncbi:CdaR family transcriptional regulator [Adlercreutzia sp. ZJ473]|uniref:PucR family transcriptional regulator n=1 Tax=Adlercreutzia sp. ZJ473 TaxID=2722822 RepID=UPI0015578CB0|nr:helix-turn-helix domain-containing protein [Adlercreutzia sp. ZJ473]